jgi:hypothetical protein
VEDVGNGRVPMAMADRYGDREWPEWILNEGRNEDLDIVSLNEAGDGDGAFEICQS